MKRKTKRKSSLINKTGFTPGFDTENNFINYIPSEDITMRNTPYPLNATPLDQYGNPIGQTVTMQPGQDYRFGGASYVAETRMFKDGGKQEWISNKIGELVREGRPQKQAIAIAYSMYEQKHKLGGRQLPMLQKGPEDMGGFKDPTMPDLGPNPFGQTAIAALPSSITSNSQYSVNQATQNLPTNWSATGNTGANPNFSARANQFAGSIGSIETPNTQDFASEYFKPKDSFALNNKVGEQFAKDNPLPAGVTDKSVPEGIGYTPKDYTQQDQGNTRDAREAFESGQKSYQFYNPHKGYGIGESLVGAGKALGQGKKGEAAFYGLNAGLEIGKSFLAGLGTGRKESSITRGQYEGQRDYMIGKPEYDEGGEMEDDTEMEDMDDMDDLPMKQRIAMLAQSYQMPELNLPQYETQQQQEEMRKGGYYKFGGKSYPMYQEGDLYGEEKPDLIQKYSKEAAQKQAIQQRFVPQPAIYPQPEPTVNDFGFPITNSAPQLSQAAKERPKEVWEIWQEKTGTPWSAAKKAGYTDGSAKANLDLADRLMRGEKLEAPKNTKPATKKATPAKAPVKTAKDYTYQDYLDAMKNKPKSKKQQGEIRAAEDNDYLARTLEIAGNPVQSFGYYSKYGEAPPQNFSRNSKNAYDRVLGVANPAYWGNALLNASAYADQGDYRRAGVEALDALPAAGRLIKMAMPAASVAAEGASGLATVGNRGVNVGSAVGPARRAASLRNYFTPELAAGSNAARLGQGATRLGQGAKRLTEGPAQTGQLRFGFGNGGYYQEGGMQPEMEAPQEGMPEQGMPQQGGGDPMQEMMAQVVSMLQQGASPQEVLQQLVQAGIPQEQAVQIVQAAMQQAQGGQQATPQLGYGGYYQEGGQEMPAEQPQDQGNQMGQVVAQIAEALQQGANPEEVLQQLIQMGVPEQEAAQMIQMVMQQMQGAQQAPPQEEMQQQTMKMGGKYLNMLRGKTIKSYTYNPKTDSYDIKYK